MSPAFAEGVDAGLDDVCGCIEVRFADFKVDDALALAFERARLVQDFKGSLGAEPRHPTGKMQFVLGGLRHGEETPEEAKRHIIRPQGRA